MVEPDLTDSDEGGGCPKSTHESYGRLYSGEENDLPREQSEVTEQGLLQGEKGTRRLTGPLAEGVPSAHGALRGGWKPKPVIRATQPVSGDGNRGQHSHRSPDGGPGLEHPLRGVLGVSRQVLASLPRI